MRRVGALMGAAADDPEGQARAKAFAQGLRELGWVEGRNLRIDYRWAAGDAERYRKFAAELVALAPDVILCSATSSVRALLQVTQTVPIVFAQATDPVGGGLVASLARPGGNVTGVAQRDFGLNVKHSRYSNSSRPRGREWPCFAIPRLRAERASSAQSRR